MFKISARFSNVFASYGDFFVYAKKNNKSLLTHLSEMVDAIFFKFGV